MNRWESAKAIYMRTEQRAKTAFEKNITGSAHGIVKVDNVAADPGLYMPYYSLQSDLVTSPGRSRYMIIIRIPVWIGIVNFRQNRYRIGLRCRIQARLFWMSFARKRI